MRNTIKKHLDFLGSPSDPVAKSNFFLVRTKPAKFPDDPRYGLVVTKKNFRFAVSRNRAKRLLRDWIAFNQGLMNPECDYIFIARPAILSATREEGRLAMKKALAFLKKDAA